MRQRINLSALFRTSLIPLLLLGCRTPATQGSAGAPYPYEHYLADRQLLREALAELTRGAYDRALSRLAAVRCDGPLCREKFLFLARAYYGRGQTTDAETQLARAFDGGLAPTVSFPEADSIDRELIDRSRTTYLARSDGRLRDRLVEMVRADQDVRQAYRRAKDGGASAAELTAARDHWRTVDSLHAVAFAELVETTGWPDTYRVGDLVEAGAPADLSLLVSHFGRADNETYLRLATEAARRGTEDWRIPARIAKNLFMRFPQRPGFHTLPLAGGELDDDRSLLGLRALAGVLESGPQFHFTLLLPTTTGPAGELGRRVRNKLIELGADPARLSLAADPDAAPLQYPYNLLVRRGKS